jgi:hypothetical protein
MKMRKSIGLGDLASLTITFVVISIVIGLGATILSGIQDTQTSGTTAYNATGAGISAIGTFSSFLGTIAIIVIAAVIIGIVLTQFVFTA